MGSVDSEMSIRDIISKASLRAVIVLSAFTSLIAMIIYIIAVSSKDVRLRGDIDAAQLITAFLTLVGIAIGWLFGRQRAG